MGGVGDRFAIGKNGGGGDDVGTRFQLDFGIEEGVNVVGFYFIEAGVPLTVSVTRGSLE